MINNNSCLCVIFDIASFRFHRLKRSTKSQAMQYATDNHIMPRFDTTEHFGTEMHTVPLKRIKLNLFIGWNNEITTYGIISSDALFSISRSVLPNLAVWLIITWNMRGNVSHVLYHVQIHRTLRFDIRLFCLVKEMRLMRSRNRRTTTI